MFVGLVTGQETAVLCSAGLDSAVLVADEAQRVPVQPIYVSTGLMWEPAERRYLAKLLATPPYQERVRPPVELDVTMCDVYPASHWAIRGVPPAFDTPDEDVCLIGRNIVLLSKASIFCAQQGIGRIALGPLSGNPFPDATRVFFDAMARALSLGLDRSIEIVTPYASLHKADIVRRGIDLAVPFELTLSCMNPNDDLHCGRCSKCRERRDGFLAAGVPDSTVYRSAPPR